MLASTTHNIIYISAYSCYGFETCIFLHDKTQRMYNYYEYLLGFNMSKWTIADQSVQYDSEQNYCSTVCNSKIREETVKLYPGLICVPHLKFTLLQIKWLVKSILESHLNPDELFHQFTTILSLQAFTIWRHTQKYCVSPFCPSRHLQYGDTQYFCHDFEYVCKTYMTFTKIITCIICVPNYRYGKW